MCVCVPLSHPSEHIWLESAGEFGYISKRAKEIAARNREEERESLVRNRQLLRRGICFAVPYICLSECASI